MARSNRREEVYEAMGGSSEDSRQTSEDLFQNMQQVLYNLVRKYEIKEDDLKGSLDVISSLWEILEEAHQRCESQEETRKELEEKWNDEKLKRKQAERRKGDLESRFEDERYQWQTERQQLQLDKVSLETKLKQTGERNKDLVENLKLQKEKFDEDQKQRDELMVRYKKEYEKAKTSTLKRNKSKNTNQSTGFTESATYLQTPGSPAHSVISNTQSDSGIGSGSTSRLQSTSPTSDLPSPTLTTPPIVKRQLPSKNVISLQSELRHPKIGDDNSAGTETFINEEELSLQQELFNCGPDLLAPAAVELDMLRKEQEDKRREYLLLEERVELFREDKERLEDEKARLTVELEEYQRQVMDLQSEMESLKVERDELLEQYLDQPFDVYCVTKKELHEVLKKLHVTQLEVQKQAEEKQSLKLQLAKKKRKSTFKKFAEKFRSMFTRQTATNSLDKLEEEEPITSVQPPPNELEYTPKSPKEIESLETHSEYHGWLGYRGGLPWSDTLPSLYCQITLQEYHVTDKITCMALGGVYSTMGSSFIHRRRSSVVPLPARSGRARLCAEVWVASSEGLSNFIEVVDVLSKKIIDRFLVKGKGVLSMMTIPGYLSNIRNASNSSQQSSIETHDHPDTNTSSEGFNPSAVQLKSYYRSRIKSSNTTSSYDDNNSLEVSKEESEDERPYYSPTTVGVFDDSSDTSSSQTPTKAILTDLPFTEGHGNTVPQPSHSSHQDTDMATFSDGEMDWKTSTPRKTEARSSATFSNNLKPQQERTPYYTWVAPDNDNILLFYDTIAPPNRKPVKSVELEAKPVSINHINGKVCVGLNNGTVKVFHEETIMSGSGWDMNNPETVDLMVPDNPPVLCAILVDDTIWVSAGPFITLLDSSTFMRKSSKKLDSRDPKPNKLLYIRNELVLVTVVKSSVLYIADPKSANVIHFIDMSPAVVVLDHIRSHDIYVTGIVVDANNIYVATSLGKVFSLPIMFLYGKSEASDSMDVYLNNGSLVISRPPVDEQLYGQFFAMSAVTLHTHRESAVQGLVHIPLTDTMCIPSLGATGSTFNLSPSKLFNATSLPNLVGSESPILSRTSTMQSVGTGQLVQPVYHSLLVTGGKGHSYYLDDQSMFQESTAIRERAEAFQLIVWGYENVTNH